MNITEKGTEVYEMVKRHLEEHNFSFEPHDDDHVITMTVHGEDLPQPTIIRVLDEREILQVLSPIPAHIPEDKRLDAAVAVATANYGMINGCFDLDMSDGEIRYRVTQSFADMDLSDKFLRYFFGVCFFTTDKYNDRFFMLGKGMMTLEQFLEKENEG